MRIPSLLPSETQFYSEGLPAGASVLGGAFETASGSRCYFSFVDIETLVLLNRGRVQAQGYTRIVAIARGGLYAGAMLSQFTGTPMSVSTFDRASRTVRCDLGAPSVPGQRLLVVDDIAGLGHTLSDTLAYFEQLGWSCDSFVLAWDDLSRLQPTYGLRLHGARPVWPWERSIVTEQFEADRKTADRDGWSVAFDLDGVFLDDVPTELYTKDLAAALAQREMLPAYAHRPPQWLNDASSLVISARLQSEQLQTENWLQRNDLRARAVLLRSGLGVAPAQHKASAILANGVSEFVESELAQAQEIAQLVPYCVVWHYDARSQKLTRCA